MKKIFLLIILVFSTQISFAQTKIDEYERTNSDDESAHIDNFLVRLDNQPGSTGLIVIYSGENNEMLGNILRHIEGIKEYVTIRKSSSLGEKKFTERIAFKVDKSKEPLFKELWIYPKEIVLPKIEPPDLNLNNLKTKYLYASICLDCEPVIFQLAAEFADFELYAESLKKYPDLKSSIVISSPSFGKSNRRKSYRDGVAYAGRFRDLLTKKYKIDNRRISIQINTPIVKDLTPSSAKFYITPKISK